MTSQERKHVAGITDDKEPEKLIEAIAEERNDKRKRGKKCAACHSAERLTKHHLFPKPRLVTQQGKITLCRECHTRLHKIASNDILRANFHTYNAVVRLLNEKNNIKF